MFVPDPVVSLARAQLEQHPHSARLIPDTLAHLQLAGIYTGCSRDAHPSAQAVRIVLAERVHPAAPRAVAHVSDEPVAVVPHSDLSSLVD